MKDYYKTEPLKGEGKILTLVEAVRVRPGVMVKG
jgi:hypothetical protein